MNRTMITATNTMSQLQRKMDVIGTNISNLETNGYKRKESYFNELLYQHVDNQPKHDKEKGRLTPIGLNQGSGARIGIMKLALNQGTLKSTGRELDIAMTREDLFLKVDVDGETQYTRDGSLYVSPTVEGGNVFQLVTADGHRVLDQSNNPIVIDGSIDQLGFSEQGNLNVKMTDGDVQTFELGLIAVTNPQYLEHKGGNFVGIASPLSGAQVEAADIFTEVTGNLREGISLKQGHLEASNVDVSKEMTDLINVQRQYQFQARSVSMADQMMGLINGVR